MLVLAMLFSITVDYCSALIIDKGYKRLGLILSLVFNLGFLAFFKYYNFLLDSFDSTLAIFDLELAIPESAISLPIGISFYTFQSMSYTIDVYRGAIKANRNILQLATYVSMFPQLVAGPIVRYIDIEKQLIKKEINLDNFYYGLKRFVFGLSKKMLIANYCGYIADGVFETNHGDLSTPMAWIGILAYSLHIYFDFSGYSDMAIGLGRMFGFRYMENFNFPYISKSIKEFWRRWHISLSTWFRDYVYISLGGSRVNKINTYRNLLIVFFVTGLWHGASWTFVIWGFFHGFFIVLERIGLDKLLNKSWTVVQRLYTLLVVLIAWVFFKADTLQEALLYIRRMFTFSWGNIGLMDWYYLKYLNLEGIITLILGILLATPITRVLIDEKNKRGVLLFLEAGVIIGLFVICTTYTLASDYNPFIYFRF